VSGCPFVAPALKATDMVPDSPVAEATKLVGTEGLGPAEVVIELVDTEN